uniref:Uncharacterized protein n=1 Tax=uncultured marine crenarchaeote HF4000_APKG3D24 TaxID=455584 RepID=B3T7C9_9ARCH|nr:hypothetical protein ALOHA_HF4000APKG3D24ctg1g2 [uncultured marine crenarchaeote HF4000_APKG3D24]
MGLGEQQNPNGLLDIEKHNATSRTQNPRSYDIRTIPSGHGDPRGYYTPEEGINSL